MSKYIYHSLDALLCLSLAYSFSSTLFGEHRTLQTMYTPSLSYLVNVTSSKDLRQYPVISTGTLQCPSHLRCGQKLPPSGQQSGWNVAKIFTRLRKFSYPSCVIEGAWNSKCQVLLSFWMCYHCYQTCFMVVDFAISWHVRFCMIALYASLSAQLQLWVRVTAFWEVFLIQYSITDSGLSCMSCQILFKYWPDSGRSEVLLACNGVFQDFPFAGVSKSVSDTKHARFHYMVKFFEDRSHHSVSLKQCEQWGSITWLVGGIWAVGSWVPYEESSATETGPSIWLRSTFQIPWVTYKTLEWTQHPQNFDAVSMMQARVLLISIGFMSTRFVVDIRQAWEVLPWCSSCHRDEVLTQILLSVTILCRNLDATGFG